MGVELGEHGVDAEVREGSGDSGLPYVELLADLGEETPFQYRISSRETRLPVYGDLSMRSGDVYYRLDVHLREGGQGYDVMGYTHSQLIDDVLDQYEQHTGSCGSTRKPYAEPDRALPAEALEALRGTPRTSPRGARRSKATTR